MEPDTRQTQELLVSFDICEKLASIPPATWAQLRACGIRLVATPEAIDALNALAASGEATASVLAANINVHSSARG